MASQEWHAIACWSHNNIQYCVGIWQLLRVSASVRSKGHTLSICTAQTPDSDAVEVVQQDCTAQASSYKRRCTSRLTAISQSQAQTQTNPCCTRTAALWPCPYIWTDYTLQPLMRGHRRAEPLQMQQRLPAHPQLRDLRLIRGQLRRTQDAGIPAQTGQHSLANSPHTRAPDHMRRVETLPLTGSQSPVRACVDLRRIEI